MEISLEVKMKKGGYAVGSMVSFRKNADDEVEVLCIWHEGQWSVPVSNHQDLWQVLEDYERETGLRPSVLPGGLYSAIATLHQKWYIRMYFVEGSIPLQTPKNVAYTRNNLNDITRDIVQYIEKNIPTEQDMQEAYACLLPRPGTADGVTMGAV